MIMEDIRIFSYLPNPRVWKSLITAKLIDAKGGGKEDFAQAGGGDPKKIDFALTEANNFLN